MIKLLYDKNKECLSVTHYNDNMSKCSLYGYENIISISENPYGIYDVHQRIDDEHSRVCVKFPVNNTILDIIT